MSEREQRRCAHRSARCHLLTQCVQEIQDIIASDLKYHIEWASHNRTRVSLLLHEMVAVDSWLCTVLGENFIEASRGSA